MAGEGPPRRPVGGPRAAAAAAAAASTAATGAAAATQPLQCSTTSEGAPPSAWGPPEGTACLVERGPLEDGGPPEEEGESTVVQLLRDICLLIINAAQERLAFMHANEAALLTADAAKLLNALTQYQTPSPIQTQGPHGGPPLQGPHGGPPLDGHIGGPPLEGPHGAPTLEDSLFLSATVEAEEEAAAMKQRECDLLDEESAAAAAAAAAAAELLRLRRGLQGLLAAAAERWVAAPSTVFCCGAASALNVCMQLGLLERGAAAAVAAAAAAAAAAAEDVTAAKGCLELRCIDTPTPSSKPHIYTSNEDGLERILSSKSTLERGASKRLRESSKQQTDKAEKDIREQTIIETLCPAVYNPEASRWLQQRTRSNPSELSFVSLLQLETSCNSNSSSSSSSSSSNAGAALSKEKGFGGNSDARGEDKTNFSSFLETIEAPAAAQPAAAATAAAAAAATAAPVGFGCAETNLMRILLNRVAVLRAPTGTWGSSSNQQQQLQQQQQQQKQQQDMALNWLSQLLRCCSQG